MRRYYLKSGILPGVIALAVLWMPSAQADRFNYSNSPQRLHTDVQPKKKATKKQTAPQAREHILLGRQPKKAVKRKNKNPDKRYYRNDRESGRLRFGDGQRGRRPSSGKPHPKKQYRYSGDKSKKPTSKTKKKSKTKVRGLKEKVHFP